VPHHSFDDGTGFLFSYEKYSLFTALKMPRMEARVMLELTPTP
jgi:hypothetical protein